MVATGAVADQADGFGGDGLFAAVQGHFEQAAERIGLDEGSRKVLSTHRREVAVSVRVPRDDGSFDVAKGVATPSFRTVQANESTSKGPVSLAAALSEIGEPSAPVAGTLNWSIVGATLSTVTFTGWADEGPSSSTAVTTTLYWPGRLKRCTAEAASEPNTSSGVPSPQLISQRVTRSSPGSVAEKLTV